MQNAEVCCKMAMPLSEMLLAVARKINRPVRFDKNGHRAGAHLEHTEVSITPHAELDVLQLRLWDSTLGSSR